MAKYIAETVPTAHHHVYHRLSDIVLGKCHTGRSFFERTSIGTMPDNVWLDMLTVKSKGGTDTWLNI